MIQFVTRGSVQVNDGVMEVENGLSEDFSVSTDQQKDVFIMLVSQFLNGGKRCQRRCLLFQTCF